MDCKTLIEEQIEELKKQQEENKKIESVPLRASTMCQTAETISDLAVKIKNM